AVHPHIFVVTDLAQVRIGLTQRVQQFVSGTIQWGVIFLWLVHVDHDSVRDRILRDAILRSYGDSRILVAVDLPILWIGNRVVAVLKFLEIDAGRDHAATRSGSA